MESHGGLGNSLLMVLVISKETESTHIEVSVVLLVSDLTVYSFVSRVVCKSLLHQVRSVAIVVLTPPA